MWVTSMQGLEESVLGAATAQRGCCLMHWGVSGGGLKVQRQAWQVHAGGMLGSRCGTKGSGKQVAFVGKPLQAQQLQG